MASGRASSFGEVMRLRIMADMNSRRWSIFYLKHGARSIRSVSLNWCLVMRYAAKLVMVRQMAAWMGADPVKLMADLNRTIQVPDLDLVIG